MSSTPVKRKPQDELTSPLKNLILDETSSESDSRETTPNRSNRNAPDVSPTHRKLNVVLKRLEVTSPLKNLALDDTSSKNDIRVYARKENIAIASSITPMKRKMIVVLEKIDSPLKRIDPKNAVQLLILLIYQKLKKVRIQICRKNLKCFARKN